LLYFQRLKSRILLTIRIDMKKLIYLVLLLTLFSSLAVFAQQKPVTIILLRHAEKLPDGKDPELSSKGLEFAQRLAKIFAENTVNAAYTTHYKRTMETITPLAALSRLKFIIYDPAKIDQLVKMLGTHGGQTVLIAGHSNTVNTIHNALFNNTKMQPLGEDEYRKVFIITYYPGDPSKSTSLKLDLN